MDLVLIRGPLICLLATAESDLSLDGLRLPERRRLSVCPGRPHGERQPNRAQPRDEHRGEELALSAIPRRLFVP
jgi:hypothetical protein